MWTVEVVLTNGGRLAYKHSHHLTGDVSALALWYPLSSQLPLPLSTTAYSPLLEEEEPHTLHLDSSTGHSTHIHTFPLTLPTRSPRPHNSQSPQIFYFTPTSSTSKMRVELGGMRPLPTSCCPYA